ncbi:helix-turn-helix domain-containing protein [Caulobacter sp. 17J80-11]|uniref:helix-turn-helix domain-containing protein n=1 Tax=Caulobacter sp. 17J80-11 TaxID=2763502 RepID=UPI0016536059|nr:helix-turn-helix domain-containing protein [Caulobacter sp. 17J80-11]
MEKLHHMSGSPRPLAYRVNDAAKAIGLSRSTLYELRNEGKLRIVKVAGRALIPCEDLEALLGSQ